MERKDLKELNERIEELSRSLNGGVLSEALMLSGFVKGFYNYPSWLPKKSVANIANACGDELQDAINGRNVKGKTKRFQEFLKVLDEWTGSIEQIKADIKEVLEQFNQVQTESRKNNEKQVNNGQVL